MLETVSAGVNGSLEDARFTLAAVGADDPAFRLDAGGTFAMGDDATRITLATLDAEVADRAASLQRPVTVTLADGRTRVDTLALAVAGGTLTASADLGGPQPSASLTAADLPISLAELAVGELEFEGTVGADVDISRDGGQLGGRFTVSISDLVQQATAALAATPPLDVTLSGTWSDGVVDARAVLAGFGDELTATARVPFSVDAETLAVTLDENGPVSGQVRWQGETGPLVEALPVADHRVTGPGRIAIDVGGTLGDPEVTGEVVLDEGAYEHLEYGTLIRPLTVRATSTGGRVLSLSLQGQTGEQGTVSAEGRIDIGETDIDMQASLRNALLTRRDDLTVRTSGDVAAAIGPQGGQITGSVTTDRVIIRLDEGLPPSVVSFDEDVVEIRTEADAEAAAAAAAERDTGGQPEPEAPIALDLQVTLPQQVYVRGRGLESEWSGNLTITGTVEQPRIVGAIEVVRGTLNFADRPFRLTRGRIEFTGGRRIDPRIDIETTYAGDDATAVISVTGPASDPEISITSPEGLPQSEVLPRALFGKTASELSPGEAVDLAVALESLRGGRSITDRTLGSVRDALGLDVLTLDPGVTGEGGPSVRAGSYVTEDIYLEARQGTTAGTSTYRGEYRITPEIAAEAEFGDPTSDTSSFFGLKWERDY